MGDSTSTTTCQAPALAAGLTFATRAPEVARALTHGVARQLAPQLGKAAPSHPIGGPARLGVAREGGNAPEAASAPNEQGVAAIGGEQGLALALGTNGNDATQPGSAAKVDAAQGLG